MSDIDTTRAALTNTISGVLCASSKPPCTHHVAEATAVATQLRGLLLTEPAITAAANAISPDATHPEDIAVAREAAVDAITAALGAVVGDERDTAIRQARADALREFVQWVAINRAYNGSDHQRGQSLYNECLNGVLPEWADEWLREDS